MIVRYVQPLTDEQRALLEFTTGHFFPSK
jgi:hypothetical protein